MERRTFLKLAALVPGLALAGCGGSKTLLSPKDPTMLSIWHVYGEQADSPMNRLLTEFNDTVGREKGILLNVTNMTNSAAIGSQLQDAKAGKPGALDLPDLFSAHASDASALGIETLVDWNDWFTAEDMAAYVPGFVQDGIIDGKQVVFPVSKSTQLIFLNGSQYARFAADTGAQLSTLATWDGFFEMAGAYRQWSQGKPFCALDYPHGYVVPVQAQLEQGGGELYKGSWYDLTNETFRASWMEFARALVQGDILISDLYSNTQVMTGETLAGLGSSAAILYYNDFVTYPDNTTEPTDLMLAPLPHAAGTAMPLMPQAGVGLCAFKTTDQKAEAAAVFLRWLTEQQRNLEFAANTGYMPVSSAAFDAIADYPFEQQSYQRLYDVYNEMRIQNTPLSEPGIVGYHAKAKTLYDSLRQRQKDYPQRLAGGGCHLPAERRVKQELTARAAAGDLGRWAAHIDIKDVEPDALFPDKQNCLCHGLRLCAEQLDGIQAVGVLILEQFQRFAVAEVQRFGAGHLADGPGRAVVGHQVAAGSVGQPRHRRKHRPGGDL